MGQVWLQSALWIGLALIASIISIRVAISVALIEIMVGALAGNAIGLPLTEWVNFLAGFGAILLTFLAGTEIDPGVVRRHFRSAMTIGVVGFFAPYLGVLAYAHYAIHWPWDQAQIAGISLSTTSVAVVYAVMIETGFNRTEMGKIILAACFVNDLGTVLALGVVFAHYDLAARLLRRGDRRGPLPVAAIRAVVLRAGRPSRQRAGDEVRRADPARARRPGRRRRQRGGVAGLSRRHGAGAGLSPRPRVAASHAHHRLHHPDAVLFPQGRLAGRLPRRSSASAGLVAVFLAIKMATKFVGILPLTRAFRFDPREGMYTTLLMSTGLTFGTISALFGLTNHIIDRSQYTVLVTAVIGSAVVPTLIAQRWFQPSFRAAEDEPIARARASRGGMNVSQDSRRQRRFQGRTDGVRRRARSRQPARPRASP